MSSPLKPTPRTSFNRRAGAAGGVSATVAPLLMWTAFIGAGTATPGYNLLTRAASDLGARGVTTAALYVPFFFYLPGFLAVLAGLGLLATWKGGKVWQLGALLVMVEGVFLILAGAFAEDAHSMVATTVHQELAGVAFIAAALAPLALVLGRPKTPEWRPPLRLWLLTGGTLIAIYVGALLLKAAGVTYPSGLYQRPFTIVLTVWYLATGLWMLRAALRTSRPTGHEMLASLELRTESPSG